MRFDRDHLGTLRVGGAKVEITPRDLTALNPLGGGSFSGVHDPIYLRALVLSNGATELAIVTADLIEVGDMAPIRARVERELAIPADHLMITATHTHSAPRLGLVTPGALAHGGGPESVSYTEQVYDAMLVGLKQARASQRDARFGVGFGKVDVNINRDTYDAGRWGLGYNEDGPSDKTLAVLRFDAVDGAPIAVLLNYAVHSTVTLRTGQVSGDLAGAAARYVEDQLGRDAVALWTCGALGDQDPRVSHARDRAPAWAAMDALGLLVGAETIRVANKVDRLTARVRLSAGEEVAACPVRRGVDVMASMRQQNVDTVDLRLHVMTLNEVALAGVSGEVTTNLARHVRRASPLVSTILVSLANDRIGYLPEDEAYDRPTHCVNGSPIARGHGEPRIVAGLVRLINAQLGLGSDCGAGDGVGEPVGSRSR